MARIVQDSLPKKGMSPGSLVFIGDRKMSDLTFELIQYDKDGYNALITKEFEEVMNYLDRNKFIWLNIEGIHDVDQIRELGQQFGIHPLALEDVLNTNQRPKIEEYDDFLFITLKMLWPDSRKNYFVNEQFSLCLFEKMLISFQEQPGDAFDPIRERFKNSRSRLRTQGSDYLAYLLLDSVVDNYIFILERLGNEIGDLEDAVLVAKGGNAQKKLLEKLSRYKSEVNYLRRLIRPTNELVLRLTISSSELLRKENQLYMKDLQDLCNYINETIEIYREMLSDQLMIFQTSVSNKLNEVMKVLTVFSAVFIPLHFLTGVYGTNFEFIPELHYRYGFYLFITTLAVTGGITLYIFKRKKWL